MCTLPSLSAVLHQSVSSVYMREGREGLRCEGSQKPEGREGGVCVCVCVCVVYKFFHLLCCLMDSYRVVMHIPSLLQMRPDIESKLKEVMQSTTPNAVEEVRWGIFLHS